MNVVNIVYGFVKRNDTAGLQNSRSNDIIEHTVRIVEKIFCLHTYDRILKDPGITTRHHPGLEKRCPVNISSEFLQRIVDELPPSGKFWFGMLCRGPVNPDFILSRFGQGYVILCGFPALVVRP